jgi:hypothetical protein
MEKKYSAMARKDYHCYSTLGVIYKADNKRRKK